METRNADYITSRRVTGRVETIGAHAVFGEVMGRRAHPGVRSARRISRARHRPDRCHRLLDRRLRQPLSHRRRRSPFRISCHRGALRGRAAHRHRARTHPRLLRARAAQRRLGQRRDVGTVRSRVRCGRLHDSPRPVAHRPWAVRPPRRDADSRVGDCPDLDRRRGSRVLDRVDLVFGGFTAVDFNLMRRASVQDVVPLTASVLLDILNIFLALLDLLDSDAGS